MIMHENSRQNKKILFVLASLTTILFGLIVILGFKNSKLKQEFQETITATYDYDRESLEKLAKRENPNATVIHNAGDGLWEKDQKIRIVKELTFGSIDDEDPNKLFHNIIAMKLDNEGNYYIHEYNSGKIKKFDPKGSYLISIGQEGGGPGEFRGILNYVIDDKNTIWVYDYGNQRISTFTTKGKFVSSFRIELDTYPKSFIIDDEQNFYFSYYDRKNDKVIHKYNNTGNYILSFGEPIKFNLSNPHVLRTIAKNYYPGALFYHDGQIYFSQFNPYKISVYSKHGELIRQITRENEFIRPPYYRILGKEKISLSFHVQTSYVAKIQTYIVNVVYFPENREKNQMTILDFFDINGKLLASRLLKDRFYAFDVDDIGHLYGFLNNNNEFVQIAKFKLKL